MHALCQHSACRIIGPLGALLCFRARLAAARLWLHPPFNWQCRALRHARLAPQLGIIGKRLRLLLADIKRVEVDSRAELDEAGLLAVIEKAVKQRRASIEQFEKGDQVCSIYTFQAGADRPKVTMVEWTAVEGGKLARQRLFYDSAEMKGAMSP